MAKTYQTPGVYKEEIPALPPSVSQVETSVPVFIGYTERSDDGGTPLPSEIIDGIAVTLAKRITSLAEYLQYFGAGNQQTISIQINEVYTNDGPTGSTLANRTITGTVSTPATMQTHMQAYYDNGGSDCYIIGVGLISATGVTSENLLSGLKMAARYDEPSLLVIPQVNQLPTVADSGVVYNAALQQAADLQDRFVILDCYDDDPENLRNYMGTANLQYGAAYYPFIQYLSNTVDPANPATPISITLCKQYTDGKQESSPVDFTALPAEVQTLVTAEMAKLYLILPPCGAVAGVYAQTDNTRGVWKAPANISLNMVAGVTKQITDADQDNLTVDAVSGKSINAIRAFIGKGILIWGARTLAENDNEWRYVAVQRLFMMVEESAKKAVAAFALQPNNASTWTKVQSMLENYLTILWRNGAILGSKPEQAFYVHVGLDKTMTINDINAGRMIIEMGLAPLRPSEFTIIRFTQQMAQS